MCGGTKATHIPNPLAHNKTHRHTAVLEEPCTVGNVAEKLSDKLFSNDGVRYMSNEVQLGVDYSRDI